jgi:hypothetical protein
MQNAKSLPKMKWLAALAQFSRSGIARDLGRRLVADFASNLNARLAGEPPEQRSSAPLDIGRYAAVARESGRTIARPRTDIVVRLTICRELKISAAPIVRDGRQHRGGRGEW